MTAITDIKLGNPYAIHKVLCKEDEIYEKGVKLVGKIKETLQGANRWAIMFFVLLAVLVLYTGTAVSLKVTDSPEFCGNCHVMNEVARTHQMSTHANLSCNECHAPHDFLSKMPFKAYSGAKDVYMNTFGDIDDVIKAKDRTKAAINENCQRCHEMTNMNVATDSKQYCFDCHRTVPHFSQKPISERMVAGE